MEKEKLINEKTCTKKTESIYAVGIHNDKKGLLVRKSIETNGKRKVLAETYVLNSDDAAMLQQQWMQELTGTYLN